MQGIMAHSNKPPWMHSAHAVSAVSCAWHAISVHGALCFWPFSVHNQWHWCNCQWTGIVSTNRLYHVRTAALHQSKSSIWTLRWHTKSVRLCTGAKKALWALCQYKNPYTLFTGAKNHPELCTKCIQHRPQTFLSGEILANEQKNSKICE